MLPANVMTSGQVVIPLTLASGEVTNIREIKSCLTEQSTSVSIGFTHATCEVIHEQVMSSLVNSSQSSGAV